MEIVRAALKLDSSSASFTHCRYVILKCLAYFLHSPFYGPIFRTVYCPTYDGVHGFSGMLPSPLFSVPIRSFKSSCYSLNCG